MSELFEVRKIHREGSDRISHGMTIPQKFLRELDLKGGNYVKIFMGKEGSKKIWIEKLQE